ncbi:hypothetical protein TWF102_004605 [Orbilia oligospora]|uniref:Uncharacterized protein n=1 Tax=Orbilia oligospora TaxID=2813651 RepID=A0A7C8JGX6_ORBOL|nr:hypothetical protein TWF103_008041 [Orbilia oligospora]KAF3102405.1 hypothetical protein TWF102_004605 [Orbilia oligospora]KAF3122390.1 hypothetical protein TWF703_001417 [Orbilia oligospora]
MATTNLVLIGGLPPMHLERISNIVRNLFRLEITERTFRQIFDDAPLQSSNPFNSRYRNIEPSEESRIKYRKLVEELELILIGIEIGADILHRYINETGNVLVEFEVLIEILRAISGESYKPVRHNTTTRPTIPPLYHSSYTELTCYEKLPSYSLEKCTVGFWAEAQILSGVVHFDRGESGDEMLDVYLHPDNDKRLYKVDKADILQLMRLLSEDGFTSAQSLLRTTYDPIPVSDAQRKGIHRVKNLANLNLYRRLPSSIEASGFPRCVIDGTEEFRNVSIPENYIPAYGEFSVADWVARERARYRMQ